MQIDETIGLKMITVARYEHLETALRDAHRMANRDIRISIVQGMGRLLPGLGLTVELQVHIDDLDKFESHANKIAEEIDQDLLAPGDFFWKLSMTKRAIAWLLIFVMARESHLLYYFWIVQELAKLD